MNIFVRQNDNDLLKYLSDAEAQKLKKIERQQTIENKEKVLAEGAENRDIYLVAEGILEVTKLDSTGEEIIFDTVYEGEIIGEMNFIQPGKSIFGVRAKGKTIVASYTYDVLSDLMTKNKHLAAKIFAAINDSLADKNIRITQKL
jgi:CRP-like cAMP-binding protein